MPKGGARVNSGPAPDPNSLTQLREQGEWTVLPASGRAGDAPAWPLLDPTARELELWAALWLKPQAIMWDRNGQFLEVALYVRNLTKAEAADAPVNVGTLVRQLMDSLGLSTPGMRNNRWKIAPAVAATTVAKPPAQPRPSSRTRLTVVPDAAA